MDVLSAFNRLDAYCRKVDYCGWDLFDGLNSKLFKNSPAADSALFRLAWIQLFKRSPVNLRGLAKVPKGSNAKGLALFASGLIGLGRIEEAQGLLKRLKQMRCTGYEQWCWGYNFPWESRAYYVPLGVPNMVATVFAANAFLDHFGATGDRESFELARSACEFIFCELILFETKKTLSFGYIPGRKVIVHNANLLGAALLGRVFGLTGDKRYYQKSRKAISYGIRALNSQFLWPYGELYHHGFIDSFHTGFNLVSIAGWLKNTGDVVWEAELEKAYRAYLDFFWLEDGAPKYYHDTIYPQDIHCSAQGIITLLCLAGYDARSEELLSKIVAWVLGNMQDETGYFYYQKSRFYTNKISYIRWAQSWMFHALSLYLGALR
ncbi:MAG: hypothetical protein ACP5IL_14905 [Syntrophobacteraceae bacterium]